jgi:exosortase/archaeosortase family protein
MLVMQPASGRNALFSGRRDMYISSIDMVRFWPEHARKAASSAMLFCGLVGIGFLNGISERAGIEIERNGVVLALFGTLGTSVVVWAAAIVGVAVLLRSPPRPITATDGMIALFAFACFLVPAPFMSWLGIAAIGAHLRLSPRSEAITRRAGTIFVALTVPMLWTRILFASASTTILAADAKLIGWVLGTRSHGNMIDFADGTGVIFLEPACSSITNVSLIFLCGVLFVKGQGRAWSRAAVTAILAAGTVTVLINVVRISLIGLMPQYYTPIHGTLGTMAATWTTIAAMLAIFSYGIGIGEQTSP